jgi:hypothetical protein
MSPSPTHVRVQIRLADPLIIDITEFPFLLDPGGEQTETGRWRGGRCRGLGWGELVAEVLLGC